MLHGLSCTCTVIREMLGYIMRPNRVHGVSCTRRGQRDYWYRYSRGRISTTCKWVLVIRVQMAPLTVEPSMLWSPPESQECLATLIGTPRLSGSGAMPVSPRARAKTWAMSDDVRNGGLAQNYGHRVSSRGTEKSPLRASD